MTNTLSHAGRDEKVAILVRGAIGAGFGWLMAAWYFLHNGGDGSLLVALLVMFLVTWYGARRSRWLWWRIACAMGVGGALIGLQPLSVSGREPDRVVEILQSMRYGNFSYVPWGLAGALLFLVVLVAMARPEQVIDPQVSESGAAGDVDSAGR